jgi:hypothetical protein
MSAHNTRNREETLERNFDHVLARALTAELKLKKRDDELRRERTRVHELEKYKENSIKVSPGFKSSKLARILRELCQKRQPRGSNGYYNLPDNTIVPREAVAALCPLWLANCEENIEQPLREQWKYSEVFQLIEERLRKREPNRMKDTYRVQFLTGWASSVKPKRWCSQLWQIRTDKGKTQAYLIRQELD